MIRLINLSLKHQPIRLSSVGESVLRDNNYKEIKDPFGKVFKYNNSKEDFKIIQPGLHKIIKNESISNFYANIEPSELQRNKLDEQEFRKVFFKKYILIPKNADLVKITNEARSRC